MQILLTADLDLFEGNCDYFIKTIMYNVIKVPFDGMRNHMFQKILDLLVFILNVGLS